MARKNSVSIEAESVEVNKLPNCEGLTVKIKNPSEGDLIRLISECSTLLDWRRNRGELPSV